MDERPKHDEKNLLHMRLHKLQELFEKEKQEEYKFIENYKFKMAQINQCALFNYFLA